MFRFLLFFLCLVGLPLNAKHATTNGQRHLPTKAADHVQNYLKDTFLNTVYRDYHHDGYCQDHFFSRDLQVDPELLFLIPEDQGHGCYYIDCSTCHKMWVEEVCKTDKEGNVLSSSFERFCECKDKLRKVSLQERQSSSGRGAHYDDCMKMDSWEPCEGDAIFYGYFDSNFKKYSPIFFDYLDYIRSNPSCTCFWPERSDAARSINEEACTLFFDLFQNTRLRELVNNAEMQEKFGLRSNECLTAYGLTLQCITHAFFYSDYKLICKDLLFYSYRYYRGNDLIEIQEKIDSLLDVLDEQFTDLYKKCQHKHPSEKVAAEITALQVEGDSALDLCTDNDDITLNGETSDLVCLPPSIIQQKAVDKTILSCQKLHFGRTKHSKKPAHFHVLAKSVRKKAAKGSCDIWLSQGEWLNGMMLYKDAIESFSHALLINPRSEEALLGRALAYFELGRLNEAIADYEKVKKLLVVPPYSVNKGLFMEANELVFAKGMIDGNLMGGAETVKGFIPGLMSTFTGIGRGLWVFLQSPEEVSRSFITNVCLTVEYVKKLSKAERYEFFAPEVCELVGNWDKLSDYDKGYKTGFLIGKYSVDIFAFRGGGSGLRCPRIVKKYKEIKRADTLLTLEQCAASPSKKAVIVAKTVEHAAARAAIISASKGKIFVLNVIKRDHILKKNHAWGKVVFIAGKEHNEENITRVIALLEEYDILNPSNLEKTILLPESKNLIRTEYVKAIKSERVRAVFVTNTETGERFLNDAWVITREP